MAFVPKIGRAPPAAPIRSSLMFNPVEGVSALDAVSFADVMVKAVNSPRTAANSNSSAQSKSGHLHQSSQDAATLRAKFTPTGAALAYAKKDSPPEDLERRKTSDLYSQLDSMLGKRSLLLAVA